MVKNIYLTRKEQAIFRLIRKTDIVTHAELTGFFPKEKNINKTVHGLISKGYLFKLKKGLYLVNEEGKLVIKNPYTIASALFRGYIGMSSALKIHGLLDYEPFTIFVVTPNTSSEKRIADYAFKAINLGKKATGQCFLDGVYVSTLSKTLFDCFYRPRYSNYGDITKAVYEANGIDWKEFLYYFMRFASPSLYQRTGYVLDQLKKETGLDIPEHVIKHLGSHLRTRTRLLPSDRRSGVYVKEWKVMDNVGKQRFLSWWYHG